MNNKFDFNRFGKLLAVDGKKYFRNFGITLAILCSLNVATWLTTAVFGFTMPVFVRWMVIYVAVFLSCILVPAKAFGDINLPRDGVRYAMLPVSNLEKYLSYVLYCVMTPVVVALASWGIDSLLTLIPAGGFQSFIKSLGMMGAMSDFMSQLADPSGVLDPSDLTEDYYLGLNLMNKLGTMEVWNYLASFLFTTGFFMMGNLLFKRHKTGITFGILMGANYAFSTIMQVVMLAPNLFNMSSGVNFESIANMVGSTMWVSIAVNAILTIALFVGLFYKLKTQKY